MELELPDKATTMILNTKGTHGEISKDLKSFYDYVNNHIVTTDFTKQIDNEISYLKLDTKVRREYMLMEARLLDERREGIAEGKDVGLVEGEAVGIAKGEAKENSLLLNVCWLKDAILSRLSLSLQIYLSLMWRS